MGDYSIIKPLSLIRCDGEVRLGSYSEISSFSVIYGCSNFRVGDKCYIGPQTWINVSEDVTFGNGVGIGPRTMIFTHGSFLPYTEGYPVRFGEVSIGNNVWIPAGVFIHPGVQIGDNVLVGSRSVIKKNIPAGQYVEGFPAKEIRPLAEIRHNITPEQRDILIENILEHFIKFMIQTEKVKVNRNQDHTIDFRFKGRDYLIAIVNSAGMVPVRNSEKKQQNIIVLSNHGQWKVSSFGNKSMRFDFIAMKTTYTRDPLHHSLYLFLKMYYGIIFEFTES